jgi:phospholipid transport system substrate-binding protein
MKNRFSTFALAGASAVILLASQGAAAAMDLRMPVTGGAVTAVNAATGQNNVTEGAKNFIASMGERGINFLGDSGMSPEAKRAEFRRLLNDSFDMNTIGRFSLGTYWRSATPAQQKEYLKLFNTMIVKVYSQRFSEYQGQKFDVRSARPEGKDSLVTSFIVPASGPEVRVDWRVRSKNGSYKVVDIIVEGVSMSQTQRADFASVIQRGGGKVDVLLDHLRK